MIPRKITVKRNFLKLAGGWSNPSLDSYCLADCGMGYYRRHSASYHRRVCPHLVHQFFKLYWVERLDAVGERFVGIVMHLDDQAIGAHRHCRARQWRHLVALPGPVTGIHNDRQVAQPLDGRDDAE